MQIGIDSFVSSVTDHQTGIRVSPVERMRNILEEITVADQVGVDSFGVGEHHRPEFFDSAPAIILAAAAARTSHIRLNSAVTVLSADDPVRVFQDFATIDLISEGRAEIVAGRGSFTEAFPLFGLALSDYDSLFDSKLGLLLAIRDDVNVHWSGPHRPALTGQGIYPRPLQNPLPIWVGVGGTPQSFIRAGTLGLPLMIAMIAGQPARFRPLVDLYYEAGRRAGHPREQLKVAIHAPGLIANTTQDAADAAYPGIAEMATNVGGERGLPAPTREWFDENRNSTGAMFIGDPDTVAEKMLSVSEALGGLARITLQMTNVRLPHKTLLRGIELLGQEVAPAVRRATG